MLWTHLVSPFCRMKVSGEQFEDRIVEVHWDPTVEGWRMMRFRDDKPAGNHINTVESVIQSIRDGVEKEVVSTALRSRNGRCLTTSSSCSKIAGPSGQPGKLDTTNRTHRTNRSLLPISVRDHPASLPLSPNKNPYRLFSLNLHTLTTPIPTCKHGIPNRSSVSSIPSRTFRRTFKVFLSRRNRPQLLDLRYRTGRLGMDRCRSQSGAR